MPEVKQCSDDLVGTAQCAVPAVRDISFDAPEENILYDELLFLLAEEGNAGESLRVLESTRMFIVLGRIGKPEEELNIEAVRQDNIPVVRRASGGGTVLQGKGNLNFSLVLSKERPEARDLKRSYQFILGKCVEALGSLGIEAAYYPISDIALVDGQKKISGNAQKRGRNFIMHHGTLLVDLDLALIGKYLAMPRNIPDYRQQRLHQDFVANLGVERTRLKNALVQAFGKTEEQQKLSALEQGRLKELLAQRNVHVPF
jgi:lipoate-protein ligase A